MEGSKKRNSTDFPYLTVIWGTNADFGKEIQLSERPIMVGRSDEADLKLTDRLVSRRHFIIRPMGDGFYEIEDLGSSNGTFVNNERIKRKVLIAEDKIRAGETILKFHYKDEYDFRFFEKLYKMAILDGHTGLLNKTFFMEQLKIQFEIARRHDRFLSFVLMDIDDFKQINDRFGHPVGDVVLKKVAEIIYNQKRVQDIAGRYGGEEFGLILPETDAHGAVVLTERIRKAIEATEFKAFNEVVTLTASFGISCFPSTALDLKELIEQADEALYIAKREGKNTIVTYIPIARRKE